MDSPTSTSTSDSSDAAIYGEGPYHNIRRGIELRAIAEDFSGLFLTEGVKAGTILWKNRSNGPAEEKYRKIYGEDIQHLTQEELKYFIRYSYQNDSSYFITPLSDAEVNLDYSNFHNHSCNPNVLPQDEDHWVAIRDIEAGEQLTIDYCTFDSNPFICIERCLCGTPECREFIRADDYRIVELQKRYAGHFLPYIAKRIAEEAEQMSQGVIIGGAGGDTNDFSAASVRAYHQSHPVNVAEHNRKGIESIIKQYGRGSESINLCSPTSIGSSASDDTVASPPAITERQHT